MCGRFFVMLIWEGRCVDRHFAQRSERVRFFYDWVLPSFAEIGRWVFCSVTP